MAARPNIREATIVTFDGPISVGKTTLCKTLQARLGDDAIFYPEDGHLSSTGGDNPVDIFIEDPKLMGSAFQMLMYCKCQSRTQLALLQLEVAAAKQRAPLIMVDRSLIDNAVFADTNRRLGNIDAKSFHLYKSVLSCAPVLSLRDSRVNVQLWAPVDVCAARLMKRNESDGTNEDEYSTSYFWDLARTTFCALLSNISQASPHPQLVINWESDTEVAADRFCAIYNSYTELADDVAPLSARLSYDPCPESEEGEYAAIFNYSELSAVSDFFSSHVITEAMNAIALRKRYTPQRFYFRLPRCVESKTFSEVFPLTIV